MNRQFFFHTSLYLLITCLSLALPLMPRSGAAAPSFQECDFPSRYLAAGEHGGHGDHAPATEEARQADAYTATGVVEAVNEPLGKMLITHDPVPALNWPKMTMRFTPETPSLMEGLKKGDKVRFDFRNQGGLSIILRIEVIS